MYNCEVQLASWSFRWNPGRRTGGTAAAAAAACAAPCRGRGGSEHNPAPPRPQCLARLRVCFFFLLLVPGCGDKWASRLLPATSELFPFPPHLRPKQHSRGSGSQPFIQAAPQDSAPATTPAPASFSGPAGSRCQLRNCLERKG